MNFSFLIINRIRFVVFFQMMEQYDDEEIGGMDLDDHEGDGESAILNSILAEKDNSQAEFEAMLVIKAYFVMSPLQ